MHTTSNILFPFGWGEIEGVHNRTNFDLSRHEQFSGKTMKYFDEESKEKFTPFVIETSAGASRSFMAFLVDSYHEEEAPTAEGAAETRIVMKLDPRLAPIKSGHFSSCEQGRHAGICTQSREQFAFLFPGFLRRQRRCRPAVHDGRTRSAHRSASPSIRKHCRINRSRYATAILWFKNEFHAFQLKEYFAV